jgi:hypothetical protein
MSQAASIGRDAAARRILNRITAFIPHIESASLAHSLKIALAVLIALGVKFWFELGTAGSAAICVLVIKSNLLGTTIQNGLCGLWGKLLNYGRLSAES